jgi:hypothetical protein
MSQTLSGAVVALRAAGELLGEAGRQLTAVDPGSRAFGASGPGRFGDVGRDLYLEWQRALDARVREALAHAARLEDLAGAVARAAGGYLNIDDGARRRLPEVT